MTSNFALRVDVLKYIYIYMKYISCQFKSKVAFHFGFEAAFLQRILFHERGFVLNSTDLLDFQARSVL